MCESKTQILKTGEYHLGNITGYSPVLAASRDVFRPIAGEKNI